MRLTLPALLTTLIFASNLYAATSCLPLGGVVARMTVPRGSSWQTAGDFNADGLTDLMLSANSSLHFLRGTGDGRFVLTTINVAAGPSTSGDFTGDGVADLAVADLDHGVTVFTGGSRFPSVRHDSTLTPGPFHLAAADFDGDGKLDLAGDEPSSTDFMFLRGNGSGEFTQRVLAGGARETTSIKAMNLNGDGKPDLVIADSEHHLYRVLLGKGDGTFESPVDYEQPTSFLKYVVAGDLNGDGRVDLAASDEASLLITLVPGNGTLAGSLRVSGLTAVGPLALGDFDNDGTLDFAFIQKPQSLTLGLNRGDLGAPTVITVPTPTFYTSIIAADFDGDSIPDVALYQNLGGNLDIYLSHCTRRRAVRR